MNNKLYIDIFFFTIDKDSVKILKNLMRVRYGIKKVSIKKTELGKPYFIEPKGWFYNQSHSKKLGILALSRSEIGIDLEYMRSNRDILSIGETFYTNNEFKLLKQNNSHQKELFYHLWTRKEARLKQFGNSVWTMKTVPDMSTNRDDLKTWIIKKGKETFSLSLSVNIKENTKINCDFLNENRDFRVSVKEITFPLESK